MSLKPRNLLDLSLVCGRLIEGRGAKALDSIKPRSCSYPTSTASVQLADEPGAGTRSIATSATYFSYIALSHTWLFCEKVWSDWRRLTVMRRGLKTGVLCKVAMKPGNRKCRQRIEAQKADVDSKTMRCSNSPKESSERVCFAD